MKNDIIFKLDGRLAQLVRALGLHPRGHKFDPCTAHQLNNQKWKLLDSIIIFKSKWLTLLNNSYQLPNGTTGKDYFDIVRPDYVLVIAKNNHNEILVETQYRRGVDEILFELPAGWIKEGEDILEAAKRELIEETGYSGECHLLGEIYPQPGFISMKAYLVVINISENKSLPTPEEDENIEMEFKTQESIEELIKTNKVKDMGFLSAWALYKSTKSS